MPPVKPSGSNIKVPDHDNVFEEQWELEYFCSPVKGTIICLICHKTLRVPKIRNIKRHYFNDHRTEYDQYKEKNRNEKLIELKELYRNQQPKFKRPIKNESAVSARVSYILSELIAKRAKPFVEGEFIKECLVKVAEIVNPENVKVFQSLSLSQNAVAERVTELASNLSDQLKAKSDTFTAFSIACVESTPSNGVAHLAVFLRAVDGDINVYEELMALVPLQDSTTGKDIYMVVYKLLQEYNLDLSKLSSVATDGARLMIDVNNGFIKLLQLKVKEMCKNKPDFHHVQCIIHQEILCSKVIMLEKVLKSVKSIINIIRSLGLNRFSAFINDLESEYGGLPYDTEVSWISCSIVLDKFWKVREDIHLFIKEVKGINILSNISFLQDFSFLVDVTKHLSELNAKFQRPSQIITEMHDEVKIFNSKLTIWEKELIDGNLSHFPTCNSFKKSTNHPISYTVYVEKLRSLQMEFKMRFKDLRLQEDSFSLFVSPFTIDIDKVPSNLKMDVAQIQCHNNSKKILNSDDAIEFYRNLPVLNKEIRQFASKIISMFGSTYKSEQLLSLMKGNVPPTRLRLAHEHLDAVLKIMTTDRNPAINKLVDKRSGQTSEDQLLITTVSIFD